MLPAKVRSGTPKCSSYGEVHSYYKVYRRLVNTCISHVVINPSGEIDGNEQRQIKGEHKIKKEVSSSWGCELPFWHPEQQLWLSLIKYQRRTEHTWCVYTSVCTSREENGDYCRSLTKAQDEFCRSTLNGHLFGLLGFIWVTRNRRLSQKDITSTMLNKLTGDEISAVIKNLFYIWFFRHNMATQTCEQS